MNGKNDLLNPKIYGAEPNLLNSIAQEYFFLEEVNPNFDYEKLASGQYDVVKKMNDLFNEKSNSTQFDNHQIYSPKYKSKGLEINS